MTRSNMRPAGARRFSIRAMSAAAATAVLLGAADARAAEPLVKDGQSVAFLGDSITANGARAASGYVRLVASGLAANGIHIRVVPAGVSGNTSKDMLARLDRDVVRKTPDWVTISCGVNDVWHGATGVPLEPYQRNMTDLVDRCRKAGISVLLLTSTPIGEDPANPNNGKLKAYNDSLRQSAARDHLPLADLNADFAAELARRSAGAHPPGNLLTVDGVHMNPLGDRVMAVGILRGFGLSDAQVHAAESAWLDVPAACDLPGHVGVTLRQYERLTAVAARRHQSVPDLLADLFAKAVARELDARPDGGGNAP